MALYSLLFKTQVVSLCCSKHLIPVVYILLACRNTLRHLCQQAPMSVKTVFCIFFLVYAFFVILSRGAKKQVAVTSFSARTKNDKVHKMLKSTRKSMIERAIEDNKTPQRNKKVKYKRHTVN